MKKLLLTLGLLVNLLAVAPAVTAATFQPLDSACQADPSGKKSSAGINSPACQQYNQQKKDPTNNPIAGPTGVLQTTTNVMALLTGIVAVFVIIASGVSFMTAGGNLAGQRAGDNPSKAKKARAQLTSAVIGLVIVALSWSIITFIIQKFVQ